MAKPQPQTQQSSEDARGRARRDVAALAGLEKNKKALHVLFAARELLRKEEQRARRALIGKKISFLNEVDNG